MAKALSRTCGLILGTEVRKELLSVADSPEAVALVIDECLGSLDLTDPENVGTFVQVDSIDFSFLLPDHQDGVFATIADLVERADRDDRLVSVELDFRLEKLLAAVDVLIGNLRFNARAA